MQDGCLPTRGAARLKDLDWMGMPWMQEKET